MAKVFTIIPGLENMGAMKTGGQGSVYKGRRIGEIITAIKLLPTPIVNENEDSKSYRDFKNEVAKLKKVNEEPNPNVVKILSSGLSETGNFPFIEMEYIEGPDLEELLRPPHDPIFSIKEVIKVAEHLSNALAHCHRKDVKHGDIKSNNVKFNIHTGNYMLLDFGLAVMSDEQRRTSLRQAGAIEFMAPEQNEGQMLFETDVYSFGIVLFELLAGKVPFPLQDKGETARNHIRLSHMETAPPDLMQLRAAALPESWSEEKKHREMQVPDWLVKMIYKCLEKNPVNRFHNGIDLNEYVIINSTHSEGLTKTITSSDDIANLSKEQLQQHVVQYRQQLINREKELNELKAVLENKQAAPIFSKEKVDEPEPVTVVERRGVSTASFVTLLLITLALGAFSAYSYYKNLPKSNTEIASTPQNVNPSPGNSSSTETTDHTIQEEPKGEPIAKKVSPPVTIPPTDTVKTSTANDKPKTETQPAESKSDEADNNTQSSAAVGEKPEKSGNKYVVVSKAYFYTEPDEATRRSAYMVPSDKAVLTATDDMNGFVYVTFTNQFGQTSKGWLRKADLKSSE